MKAKLLQKMVCMLGESPVHIPTTGELLWIDAAEGKLYSLSSGADDAEATDIPGDTPLGMVSATSRPGTLLISRKNGLILLERETGNVTPFAHPLETLPHLFYNDGKVDHRGRLWLGTAEDTESQARGILFRLDGNKAVPVDAGFAVCNGPAINIAGTRLYLSDSVSRQVFVYEIDDAGRLSNREVFLRLSEGEGLPDGMTLDSEDCLWLAHWGGGCISRYAPDGTRLARVTLPVPLVTSLCFGGPDNRQLFITTARVDMEPAALVEAPLSGSVFIVETQVTGVPAPVMALPA